MDVIACEVLYRDVENAVRKARLDMPTKDYRGHSIGLRISETDRTVKIIYRAVKTEWRELEPPRSYPVHPSEIPTSAITSAGAWELAWVVLRVDNPSAYYEAKAIVT